MHAITQLLDGFPIEGVTLSSFVSFSFEFLVYISTAIMMVIYLYDPDLFLKIINAEVLEKKLETLNDGWRNVFKLSRLNRMMRTALESTRRGRT